MPTNPASDLSKRSRITHNPKLFSSNNRSLVAMASSVLSRETISSSHKKRRTPGLVQRACNSATSPDDTGSKSQREVVSSVCKVAIEIRGTAIPALREQRVIGNVADAHPSQLRIQAGGVAVGDRIEHEQGLTTLARRLLGGTQQRCAKPFAAGAAVHLHLGQVGAVDR